MDVRLTPGFTAGPLRDTGWHSIDGTCDHRLPLVAADRRAVQPVVMRHPACTLTRRRLPHRHRQTAFGSGLTRAAFRNSKADPTHSAMKNPLRIEISMYCRQAIIAITANNA